MMSRAPHQMQDTCAITLALSDKCKKELPPSIVLQCKRELIKLAEMLKLLDNCRGISMYDARTICSSKGNQNSEELSSVRGKTPMVHAAGGYDMRVLIDHGIGSPRLIPVQ